MKSNKIIDGILGEGHKLLIPLGYYYLRRPIIHKRLDRKSTSSFHNTNVYRVGMFYKPISLILK